jgi:predicted ATPase
MAMLDRLTIENLKGFGPRQEAELAPLTLIYGPNSGGKSTLIQALLLLKQTLAASGELPPRLVTAGPHTNVGAFAAAIHRQDVARTMRIGITYNDRGGEYRHFMGAQQYLESLDARKERVTVEFAYRWRAWERIGCQEGVTLGVGDRLPECAFAADEHLDKLLLSDPAARLAWIGHELEERSAAELGERWRKDRGRSAVGHNVDPLRELEEIRPQFDASAHFPGMMSWSVAPDMAFAGYDEARLNYWDRIEDTWWNWAEYYGRVLRRVMDEVAYLGPLRRAPERYHVEARDGEDGVGSEGQHTWQVLARDVQALSRVNGWLERHQIPYVLTIERLEERAFSDLLLVQLTDRRNGAAVSPRDVGFGVSQVLPLVVAASGLHQGTLCIEQPELHLHPRLQAELADMFIECTRSESDRPSGQVLIETHSEALMLRVQRRIRQGVLKPEDVSVLYVDPECGTATTVKRLRLDRLGRFIDEWPGGFFEERLNETLLGLEN